MKYDKHSRQAIKTLSQPSLCVFEVLEKYEQGELVAIPELCDALNHNPIFVAFSCLTGDGQKQEVDQDLGILFKERKRRETNLLLHNLDEKGYTGSLLVILDDCEPRRVWQWKTPQHDITNWCQMIIEDARELIPKGCEVKLWSELEKDSSVIFEGVLEEMNKPAHSLLLHQHLEHMKKFPNKKLIGDMKRAALRRVAEYALQGAVLEKLYPSAILIQTETPYGVKDPLFLPLRKKRLPIIHPYPERR